jgi:periplasmic divalent cation tolerance protein
MINESPICIFTTAASRDEAARIADELVARRLAACVQILGPIASTYRWQGKIEHSEEWQSQIKTDQRHYAAVEQTIRELHSYETPEVIAVPITAGSEDYLTWLQREIESGRH